jgi:orc1/cdc6 family replication initiation protein
MVDSSVDVVFKNRKVLSPGYTPKNLPNRVEEIRKISQVIYDFLKGHTTHLLISGPPGSGKTASIHLIFDKLSRDSDVLACYVNCFNKNTRMGVLYSIFLEYFKRKKPTRRMPCRRGIAYDELLDSFREEIGKTKTKVVVCLDEVDQLRESKLIYDLTRARLDSKLVQIIAISNDPLALKGIDPRTRSSLYPLDELFFKPYTSGEMRGIVKAKVSEAFQDGVVSRDVISCIADFTVDCKGDVRIVRESLLRAGELARKNGDGCIGVGLIESIFEKSKYARSMRVVSRLSKSEQFMLRLIPEHGFYYPEFFHVYRSTSGNLSDRMFRNYLKKFQKLKLINLERKGVEGCYFVTSNLPRDVLFEVV